MIAKDKNELTYQSQFTANREKQKKKRESLKEILSSPANIANFVREKKSQIEGVLDTAKGFLDLNQGETLGIYNKLSEISTTYLGVSIQEGRRFVTQVKNDIDDITNSDVLSGENKDVLSKTADALLDLL